MKRILFLAVLVLCLPIKMRADSSPAYLKVYPQTDTPDLYLGKYTVGWKVPIQITEAVFSGLKVSIVFSTAETARNEAIISLGSGLDQGKNMDFGITLKEAGSQIEVVRRVSVHDKVKAHTCPSWNKNLLERGKNYILTIEIDETRFRYSVQDATNPKDIKYEYQYDGLSPTYVREQMVKNGIYVAVNRYHYLVQSLEVTELGYGVGVKPIIPDPYFRHGRIKNVNSGFYLSRKGSTGTADYLQQKALRNNANELWKLTDERQSNRSINAFDAVITSTYRDTYIGPRNCTTSDGAYIYEMTNSDCSIWTIESNHTLRPAVYYKNKHSNGYLTAQYSSKQEDAYIYQQLKTQEGSKWLFEDVKYPDGVKEGYYTVVNDRSDLYLVIYGKGSTSLAYAVQGPNDYSDCNVWYFSRDPEGTYRIRNVDTHGYLADYWGYFDPGSYVVQSYTLNGSPEKWVLKHIEDITYFISSYCSGMHIGPRYDSKEPYEYIVQNESSDISYQWIIREVDFYAGENLHGFYKLQDIHSSKFLGVEGDSSAKDAYLILKDKADDPSGWWCVERDNDGPYVIRNVKSQLCVSVQNRSVSDEAYLVQEALPERLRGHFLWRLKKDTSNPHSFFFSSVFDGRYMTVKNHATAAGSYIIQKIPKNGPPHPDPEMSWRLVPVEYGVIKTN